MSKNGYGEMTALLQYIDKVRNEKPKGLFRKQKKEKEIDLISLLEQKKREAKVIENFIEEQTKLNKKEDKKEKKGWDAMSPLQQAAYLTFGMQVMSLLYFSFLIKLLK